MIYEVLQNLRFSRFIKERYNMTMEEFEKMDEGRRKDILREFLKWTNSELPHR